MHRSLKLAIFALAITATPALAIDCRRAYTPAEETVCDSGELRRLDAQINRLYQEARDESRRGPRRDMLRDWRDWLDARERCGRSAGCIRRVYLSRIRELRRERY